MSLLVSSDLALCKGLVRGLWLTFTDPALAYQPSDSDSD